MNPNYPIPLNSIRYFYQAAKLGSFKKAAEKLFVTEAAVSQQIRNLESVLGVQLFVRGHQKVALTQKGEELLPYVNTAFEALSQGINSISDDKNDDQLVISTTPSFASNWLISKLNEFRKLYPDIKIRLDATSELCDFEAGNIDVAIRYGKGNYGSLSTDLLMFDPYVLTCHPDLIENNKFTSSSLNKLPFILEDTSECANALKGFASHYQLKDEVLNDAIKLNDTSFALSSILARQGVSLFRLSMIAKYIYEGQLIYCIDFIYDDYNFYAVYQPMSLNKRSVNNFLNWLKPEMAKTAEYIKPLIK